MKSHLPSFCFLIPYAPTVDGLKKVQWRIRIDPNYHVELEPFYTDWNYLLDASQVLGYNRESPLMEMI